MNILTEDTLFNASNNEWNKILKNKSLSINEINKLLEKFSVDTKGSSSDINTISTLLRHQKINDDILWLLLSQNLHHVSYCQEFINKEINNIKWNKVDRVFIFTIEQLRILKDKINWNYITYINLCDDKNNIDINKIKEFKKYIKWDKLISKQYFDRYYISDEIYLEYYTDIIKVINENILALCIFPKLFMDTYTLQYPDNENILYAIIKHQLNISNTIIIKLIKSNKLFSFDNLLSYTKYSKISYELEEEKTYRSFEDIITICKININFNQYKMSKYTRDIISKILIQSRSIGSSIGLIHKPIEGLDHKY